MKTQQFILALLALTFAFAPQSLPTASAARQREYRATLTSPQAGEVLVPGQVFRVKWNVEFPDVGVNLTWCDADVRLSLDGGRTFMRITGELDPRQGYFDWVVPNMPTRAAVLDIRFGCLGVYPETSSPQVQSPFVISSLD
ncbi:MAG: hypothetical protein DMF06_13345 [Verrucomicrobia bacterium]|jgi:hypothetical protein|nr:MAG: hypothetical protein DMF06_13345 [Verrucomicrobiota bacterium]